MDLTFHFVGGRFETGEGFGATGAPRFVFFVGSVFCGKEQFLFFKMFPKGTVPDKLVKKEAMVYLVGEKDVQVRYYNFCIFI